MQFKLFGPEQIPPIRFRRDLKTFLRLNQDQWQTITDWFLSTDHFDPEDSLSDQRIAASTLLPEDFVAGVEVIRYILEAWHLYQLELTDIQRDLLLLGFTTEQIERVGNLLKSLAQIKGRVFEDYMRIVQEDAVLPALEDVNIVCDVRAIFEDHAYPPSGATKMRHTKVVGFRPLVLMEILTEDSFGRKQKLSFQMNEDEFGELHDALKRARDQLDALKAKTAILSKEEE